jgi:CRP-like cAMP-binding protein
MADFFDRIVILKRTPIFSEVATDDLRVVVEEMQEEAYFKGERVFEINDPSDRMYIVLNGKIGISINPDPKVEDFVSIVEEGGCFGEMGPLDGLAALGHRARDRGFAAALSGQIEAARPDRELSRAFVRAPARHEHARKRDQRETSHRAQRRAEAQELAAWTRLLDYLVGAQQYRIRHLDAERLGCFEIYGEFKFGGLLNRDIRGFRPFHDFTDHARCWRPSS